jgi:hypothetical protein
MSVVKIIYHDKDNSFIKMKQSIFLMQIREIFLMESYIGGKASRKTMKH